MIADIIVGLQHGDCGKGKVTYSLCKEGNYTHVIRYNGGCNAGHTIIHEGEKFVTHHIPAGVFFGIKSFIIVVRFIAHIPSCKEKKTSIEIFYFF